MAAGAKPFPTAPDSDLPTVLKALHLQHAFTRFAIDNQMQAAGTRRGVRRSSSTTTLRRSLPPTSPSDPGDPTQNTRRHRHLEAHHGRRSSTSRISRAIFSAPTESWAFPKAASSRCTSTSRPADAGSSTPCCPKSRRRCDGGRTARRNPAGADRGAAAGASPSILRSRGMAWSRSAFRPARCAACRTNSSTG